MIMNKGVNRTKSIKPSRLNIKRQAGVTLIEAMISLGLSLLVTTAMVVLMANSLGTATRGIHMTQLTDELRNAMSMMTRDVRRANYSANSIFCYGYSKCGFAGGNALQLSDVQIAGECFIFALDRGFNGDATDDAVGGFRRVPDGGVGVVEMWASSDASVPDCNAAAGSANWIALTDPSVVNVTAFTVDDSGSIVKEITESKTSSFFSRQREILLSLQGELMIEAAKGNTVVTREVTDTVYVRNDYIQPTI